MTDILNTKYDEWLEACMGEVEGCYRFLSESLSNDLGLLAGQLRRAESLHARMWSLHSDAEAYVLLRLEANWMFLRDNPDTVAGLTADAKGAWVKSHAAVQSSVADKLKGIVKSLEMRVSAAQSLNREAKGMPRSE